MATAKRVVLTGTKGGTGKTTTAQNLAVMAATEGEEVVLIDIDPQITAAKWFDRRQPDEERRNNANPVVVSAQPARLPHVLATAQSSGATLAIIDTPPKSAEAAIAASRGADLVLIALRPETNDVETLEDVRDLLALAGNPPAFVVFTQCPIQGEYEIESAAVAERHYGFQVCPHVLHMRRAFANATWPGQSAAEYEPGGKAAQEVRALYKFVVEQLNSKPKENIHGPQSRHARGA